MTVLPQTFDSMSRLKNNDFILSFKTRKVISLEVDRAYGLTI